MFNLTLEGREAMARGETKINVFVYWNLHRKVWSVKALHGHAKGKVIAHASVVTLLYPFAKVSEAGRQRVLAEGRKNVHAGLVGLFDLDQPCRTINTPTDYVDCVEFRGITYNPHRAPSFTFVDTGRVFEEAEMAMLWTDPDERKSRVTVRLEPFADGRY